jgi:hypothetical protein
LRIDQANRLAPGSIRNFGRKCLQETDENARLNAMFVKIVTFLSLVFALVGNIHAGVISATWMDHGGGESLVCSLEPDSSRPSPSERDQEERKEMMLCPASQSGLAGIATSAGGLSFLGVALSGGGCALLAEPELRWRLHLDDDSLPSSPVLSGLLKPS